MKFRIARTALVTLMAIFAVMTFSCGPVSKVWDGGGTAGGRGEMMLVRREPPSYGYQRVEVQEGRYPDLRIFIAQKGLPDFLAETGNQQRQYFILYYLAKRQAFACRSKVASKREIEFAGPYPITDREYHLLDDFRRNRSRVPPAR